MLGLPLRSSNPDLADKKYIAAMFGSGEQGAWYDPSDLSTMYQDAAGTIPVTAVGQPVGKILDKSGRGNHATQGTTTRRPTLQQDASGKYYLSFDGVDDYLSTGSINFTATDKMTVFTADHSVYDNPTGPRAIVGLSTSVFGYNGTWWLTAYDSTYNAKSAAYLRGNLRGAGGYGPDQRTLGVRRLVRSFLFDISKDVLANETLIRLNGVPTPLTSTPLDPSAGSGAFGNYPLYIGAVGPNYPFKGNLYGLIVRGAQTDDDHLTHAEQYLAYKSGVTL